MAAVPAASTTAASAVLNREILFISFLLTFEFAVRDESSCVRSLVETNPIAARNILVMVRATVLFAVFAGSAAGQLDRALELQKQGRAADALVLLDREIPALRAAHDDRRL